MSNEKSRAYGSQKGAPAEQTITCQCGSVVKATNVKAHERTKRHQNFVGAKLGDSVPAVRGQKPLLPPPTLPTRGGKSQKGMRSKPRVQEPDARRAIEDEDYDSQEDDDEVDELEDELEDELDDEEHSGDEEDDELMMAVEHLVEGQHLISEQVQNLHNSVPLSFESIRKRLDEVEANVLKSLKEFVAMYNEHRSSDKGVKPSSSASAYINDKCQ